MSFGAILLVNRGEQQSACKLLAYNASLKQMIGDNKMTRAYPMSNRQQQEYTAVKSTDLLEMREAGMPVW